MKIVGCWFRNFICYSKKGYMVQINVSLCESGYWIKKKLSVTQVFKIAANEKLFIFYEMECDKQDDVLVYYIT
jgi:hypothetical protein